MRGERGEVSGVGGERSRVCVIVSVLVVVCVCVIGCVCDRVCV